MTETKNLTCIGCPLGCSIQVEMENGKITNVSGNTCKRGDVYARKEVTHPTRIVTGTVRVENGNLPVVSVKTKNDIPKEKIMDVMQSIREICVQAPVHVGDLILKNAGNTGVDLVATKEIQRKAEIL